MAALRERLQWGPQPGQIHDGPRLYLMMRPDVLMGAVIRLGPAARADMLQALAESTHDNGMDSLRAYAQSLNGDREALIAATVAAAADLGWGEWAVSREGEELVLQVRNSPFVAGWRLASRLASTAADRPLSAEAPVCSPVRGMFTALAGLVLDRPLRVIECQCAATAEALPACRFSTAPAG